MTSGASASGAPLRLATAGLIALAVGIGFGRFVYTPILPAMMSDLGLSVGTAGLIASANFAGYLVGALLGAGPWLRGSPRTWLLAALVASTATTAAMGLVTTTSAFLILRFLGGIVSAFVLVFSSAVVLERLNADGRGDLSAVHFAGTGAGVALSALLTSGLAAAGWDWRGLWLASGALSTLGALAVAALLPRAATASLTSPQSAGDDRREPRALLAAYGLFGFGYVITATFLVALVRGSAEARPVEPFVWLIVGLAAIPSVAAWTWAARRIGESRAFALGCALEGVGVAVSVLWPTAAGAVLAALLLGGTYMGVTALGLVAARNASGAPRQALARMTAAFGLGQMIGPVAAGWAAERLGGGLLFPSLAAAGALLVAAGLTWSIRSRPA